MTTAAPLTPAVPTPGLIASLSASSWVDRVGDQVFAPMLITHPPARRDADTAAVIEARMLSVAHALGAAPGNVTLPDVGVRVAVHNGVVLVRLDGTPHMLTTRAGNWGRAVTEIGHVLLAVGLDPLSPAANAVETNEYITTSVKADRVYFAAATVADSPRLIQAQADRALRP
ncbi:hypothetical protein [Streptomyces indicus]|uniref:Uncharacterized protein n=1 Tax=Streptomyces indicus TaxID=417292 RepID=A0A1G9K0Q6_9ACTN|nr:hypothetical protein [Streptomyces indicus]SDL43417.1 hypothetical protein SAMN05421806_14011 [Streptomyces indicus]